MKTEKVMVKILTPPFILLHSLISLPFEKAISIVKNECLPFFAYGGYFSRALQLKFSTISIVTHHHLIVD